MQKNIYWLLLITLFAASCGSSKKDKNAELNDKKAELENLKNEQKSIIDQIIKLETEIAKIDTSAARAEKTILVEVTPLQTANFSHFIELQGKVEAQNISYVAPPNGQGGIVTALYVKEGQQVRKGQILAKLDDQLIRQQIEPLKVQLSAAEDTYKRTKNMYDQGVGTYQQVLTAQTTVDNLRKQIDILQRQISLMTVKAPQPGVADQVNVRVGEAFIGTSAAGPQISIVNTSDLKIITQVPENYLNKVSVGTPLEVYFPELNRTVATKISVVGKVIEATSRSFNIEARLPASANFKPNQIALVKIKDYSKEEAITIPMNTLQNDEKGKYVMVAVTEKGKMIARKRPVIVGELYNDKLEVKSGLQPGDVLITEGFQSLYEGQAVTTQTM